MSTQKYFGSELLSAEQGAEVDLRVKIALDILRGNAIHSAQPDGTDTSGRQKLRVLEPREVAQRALAIASHLVAMAEVDGLIRPAITAAEAVKREGELAAVRSISKTEKIEDIFRLIEEEEERLKNGA